MKKSISILINISLVLTSSLFFLAFLEFVAFRFLLIASDMPTLGFVDGIVKYQPNQTGCYRVKNEIKSRYNINSNGWNSRYDQYESPKAANQYRIAIIGDSFVEALQVDFDKSVAEQLETMLGSDRFQVYRFGISGAPLSQYLHMLRTEVLSYQPNLVIVLLVHNDFDESYRFKAGVYTSSFLKITLQDSSVLSEIPPLPYRPAWHQGLRKSATWRYLACRQQIRFQGLRNLILAKTTSEASRYQANVNMTNIEDNVFENKLAADYLFREINTLCRKNNSKLLLVMDGDRESIYRNAQDAALYRSGALKLNGMVKALAEKYQIDFIDLHPVFKADFLRRKEKFNFKSDGHWNEKGHALAAGSISAYIKQQVLK